MPTTIMIIDDDPDDRELFCDAVTELDKSIHCIQATGGHEAFLLLNDVDHGVPDFIFLDLNMPRLNGKQCLALLKKTATLKHVPVIVYSTSKRPKDVDDVRQLGAVMFLTKPSRHGELIKAIARILNKDWKNEEELSTRKS